MTSIYLIRFHYASVGVKVKELLSRECSFLIIIRVLFLLFQKLRILLVLSPRHLISDYHFASKPPSLFIFFVFWMVLSSLNYDLL